VVENVEVDELIETEHFNDTIHLKLEQINLFLKEMQNLHMSQMRDELRRVKEQNDYYIEQEYNRYSRFSQLLPQVGMPPTNAPSSTWTVYVQNDDTNSRSPNLFASQPKQSENPEAPMITNTKLFEVFNSKLELEENNDFGKTDINPIIRLLENDVISDDLTKPYSDADVIERLVYSVDRKRFKPQYVVDMKNFMLEFIGRLKNQFEQMANDMERQYEDYKMKTSECHSLSIFAGHQHERPLVCLDLYSITNEIDKEYRAFRQMLYIQRGSKRLSHAAFIADLATEKLYTKPSADSFNPIQISKDQTTTSQIISVHLDTQKRVTVVLEAFDASREKKRISILRTEPDPSLDQEYELPYFTDDRMPQAIQHLRRQNITMVNSFEVKAKDTCKYFMNKNWILSSSANKQQVIITYNQIQDDDTVVTINHLVDWQRQVKASENEKIELIFFDQEHVETNNNIVKDESICWYFGVVTTRKNAIIFKANINDKKKIICSSICLFKIEIPGANKPIRLHGMHLDIKKNT
jgi:hypothetical protein